MAAKSNIFEDYFTPQDEEKTQRILDQVLGRTSKKDDDEIREGMSAEQITTVISNSLKKIMDEAFAKLQQ